MNDFYRHKIGELNEAVKEGEDEIKLQEKKEAIAAINRNSIYLSLLIAPPVAEKTLTYLLDKWFPSNLLINKIITNPEKAMDILQQQFTMTTQEASQVVKIYFLSGYQGAMLLLIIMSLLVMLIIYFGMNFKNKT